MEINSFLYHYNLVKNKESFGDALSCNISLNCRYLRSAFGNFQKKKSYFKLKVRTYVFTGKTPRSTFYHPRVSVGNNFNRVCVCVCMCVCVCRFFYLFGP